MSSSSQTTSISNNALTRRGVLPSNSSRNVPQFLNKLYAMVNDPSCNNLIRWSEDGESFLVISHEDFAKEVLGRYFKHQNFSSFVRQLNMYGFHKVPHVQQGVLHSNIETELWEFNNSNFKRDQPDLLALVSRKKGSNDTEKEHEHLDLQIILHEIEAIKKHQQAISADLKTIQGDNQALWKETMTARERSQRQQETIDKILRFLASVFSPEKAKQLKPKKRRLLLENAVSAASAINQMTATTATSHNDDEDEDENNNENYEEDDQPISAHGIIISPKKAISCLPDLMSVYKANIDNTNIDIDNANQLDLNNLTNSNLDIVDLAAAAASSPIISNVMTKVSTPISPGTRFTDVAHSPSPSASGSFVPTSQALTLNTNNVQKVSKSVEEINHDIDTLEQMVKTLITTYGLDPQTVNQLLSSNEDAFNIITNGNNNNNLFSDTALSEYINNANAATNQSTELDPLLGTIIPLGNKRPAPNSSNSESNLVDNTVIATGTVGPSSKRIKSDSGVQTQPLLADIKLEEIIDMDSTALEEGGIV